MCIVHVECLRGFFRKNKERIGKSKEVRNSRHIFKNELGKTCFQHDMAYGDSKYLAKRTASDKVLRDKVFNITKNSKYEKEVLNQRDLASFMVYKFFDEKSSASGAITLANKSAINNRNMSNQ